jgi:hypothetical protein
MKKGILITAILLCLIVPGCEPKEITPDQMVSIGGQIESMTDQIKIYQQLITDYTLLLAESGAIDSNDIALVDKLIAQADKVTPELKKMAEALKSGNYSDNQGIITLLEGLRAANSATAGFNKYWAAIDAVLLLTIAILGWLAKKKSGEAVTNADTANLATLTLGAVTKAIETLSETSQSEIKPKVAMNLSAAQITTAGKALITKTKAA